MCRLNSCGSQALELWGNSCGAIVEVHGLSCSDASGPVIEPLPPALAVGFFFFDCVGFWLRHMGFSSCGTRDTWDLSPLRDQT